MFVNSIDNGYRVKLLLDAFGIRSAVLNSELPAASRANILSGYNRSVFDTLIATDEALMETGEAAAETSEPTETLDADDSAAAAAAAASVEESGKGKKRKQKKEAAAAAAAAAADDVKVAEEDDTASGASAAQGTGKKLKRKKDVEYGVSRGIDFKGVDLGACCVIVG